MDATSASLRGRHIAVTGANAGLGFALSKELARRDATVHLVCRNRARGEKALAEICRESTRTLDARLRVLDVSSAADIKRFVEAGGGNGLEKLRVLINNARGLSWETAHAHAEGNEVSGRSNGRKLSALRALLLPTL